MGVEFWSSNRQVLPALYQTKTDPHHPLPAIMFSLKALAVVLTLASLAEAHSSPQKRETTVSNFSALLVIFSPLSRRTTRRSDSTLSMWTMERETNTRDENKTPSQTNSQNIYYFPPR